MSTTTTKTPLDGPPSDKTLEYVSSLLWERNDTTLEEFGRTPATQRQASAWIDALKERPALPSTDEQREQIAQLSEQMGDVSFDDGAFDRRDQANRIIFSLRRRLNSRLYHEAKDQAAADLDELLGPVPDEAVPF